MSKKSLRVDIVDRDHTLWHGDAEYVSVPAVDGRLGILLGRQPMLASLSDGAVEVTLKDGQKVTVMTSGGFVSVDADYVTVAVTSGSVSYN